MNRRLTHWVFMLTGLLATVGIALGGAQQSVRSTEASKEADADRPTVMVEMQIVQVDTDALQKVDATGLLPMKTFHDPEREHNGEMSTISPPEVLIELDGYKLTYRDGKLETEGPAHGEAGKPSSVPWKVLAVPRIIAYIGQEASMAIGSQVPYMVQRDDGSFIVEHSEDVTEGISVRVCVEQEDDGMFLLKDTRVKISRVTGRVPIKDVPFDVGRPIITSQEIATTQKLSPACVSVTQLRPQRDGDPTIFVFLSVDEVKP